MSDATRYDNITVKCSASHAGCELTQMMLKHMVRPPVLCRPFERTFSSSMAKGEIILFDIPCNGKPSCWSPNVWKTRAVLNYKSLGYRTQWLEYPDIAPTLQKLGIPQNPPESWSRYSCPAIRMPDGQYVMDSQAIANKLEEIRPHPSLNLDTGVHISIHKALLTIIGAMRPMTFLAARDTLLSERSAAWFVEDRESRFGMSLDQLAKERGGETAWRNAKPGIEALKHELTRHKRDDGPFVLGSSVSYGDFLVAALCEWFRRADVSLYERLMEQDPRFSEHHAACQPYLERDG